FALVGRSTRTTVASTNGVRSPRNRSTSASRSVIADGQVGAERTALDGPPDLRRGQRHVRVPHAVRLERVEYRVDHGGRGADGGRFADALRADRVVRRGRDRLAQLPARALHGGG